MLSTFRERKSLWGVIVQAFCDANTHLYVFGIKWPRGNSDIVAYKMTELCQKARRETYFPTWGTFVLDETYGSIGGTHLTLITLHQLRTAKLKILSLY